MSLTKEAIQKITEMNTMQHSSDVILNMDCPAAALPDDFELHNLEEFSKNRYRFRGQMLTMSIDDFVNYSSGYQGDGVRCFINAEEMSAETIFNIGTLTQPGHADNKAILKLVKTAPFRAVLGINGQKQRQKNLAEFLEDWRDNILAFDADGESIDIKKAIAAVRRITIESSRTENHEDHDFKASRSAMESVEAKSQELMPAVFVFQCVPYEGLNVRDITLRMSILTGDEAPVLVLRIVQLETLTEKIALEFRDLLVNEFDDQEIETFIGSFKS